MKLFYYRDVVANFGDELNPWLFSRLLPGMLDDDDRELFLGIGSILFDTFPKAKKKIVFGCGYGGYTPKPVIDDSWEIYFVRGPRSAAAIGVDPKFAVGDAATLVRIIGEELPKAGPPTGPIFIPHWESVIDGSWEKAAADAGLTFVDPRWSVERCITAIRSSSLVVTEAMHGAIVADALRVPWVPFLPLLEKHRFKWFDWAESLDLSIEFSPSAPSSWNEWAIAQMRKRRPKPSAPRATPPSELMKTEPIKLSRARSLMAQSKSIGGPLARIAAVRALKRAAARSPYLSSDAAIERATSRMEACLARFRAEHARVTS